MHDVSLTSEPKGEYAKKNYHVVISDMDGGHIRLYLNYFEYSALNLSGLIELGCLVTISKDL